MHLEQLPLVLANHTPWHSLVETLTSPIGLVVAVGLIGIVGFSFFRKKR